MVHSAWKDHDRHLSGLVKAAAGELFEFIQKNPSATPNEVARVVEVLTNRYGSEAAASAFQALRNSREAMDLWGLLADPILVGPVEPAKVYATTAWAFHTKAVEGGLDPRAAFDRIVPALARHIAHPARQTVIQSARAAGTSWARVPTAKACEFCLMLASRGAVYESKKSALVVSGVKRNKRKAGERFHDNCHCVVIESHDDTDLPQIVRDLGDEWEQVSKDAAEKGVDVRGAWREHIRVTRPNGTALPERNGKLGKIVRAGKGRVFIPGGLFPEQHEVEAAKRVAAAGSTVRFRPLDNRPGKKNPDVEIDGEAWEIKSSKGNSKNTIANQFKRGKEQSNRLIIDLSRCGLDDEVAEGQALRRYRGQRKLVELIIVRKSGKLTRVSRPL